MSHHDSRPSDARKPKDPFLRWLAAVAAGLAALFAALGLFSADVGEVIIVLPWYVPMVHSFVALAAMSIAFLSFGRYRVLREPMALWVGIAFSAFAIFSAFYGIVWTDLLPTELGPVAQELNTAAWFWHLQFTGLAAFLLVALFARWPRTGTAGDRWWLWLITVAFLAMVAMGALSLAFDRLLPVLVNAGAWTPLNLGWIYALMTAFVYCAALSVRRYRSTGNSLFGYLAIMQVILSFAMLAGIIGGRYYNPWWYGQRILWVGGFSVMLFGLLSEYVGLYRRELEKARELEASQEEAREERSRLRVLIDTAPVGIAFYYPPDGRLGLFNKAAETIVGWPLLADRVIGDQPLHRSISRLDGSPFPIEELPASRSLRGETCVGVEMLILRPSGHQVFIVANSAPLLDGEGRVVGAVVAYQDITPIKEHEHLRDEFISAAAHELKTPVTTIKGYVQAMRRWSPEEHAQREATTLEVVNRQCDRISRRVQEMLEAVRLRRVPPEQHLTRFDLADLAGEVVPMMQDTTQIHHLVLQRDGPVPVEADRERIEELLVSLLDNAVKFSLRGGNIEVHVFRQRGDAVVSVRDYGVGIPEERQPHIFEPFYDVAPSGAPGFRGVVALSLYLSRLAIEHHKGRIWFESEPDKGSTFYFSLPLAPAT